MYGGIVDESELRANLVAHCVPDSLLDGNALDYDDFLEQRRKLMALKLKAWFAKL